MRWKGKHRRPLCVHSVWTLSEAGTNTQTQIWRNRKRWPALTQHFLYPMKMRDVSKHTTLNALCTSCQSCSVKHLCAVNCIKITWSSFGLFQYVTKEWRRKLWEELLTERKKHTKLLFQSGSFTIMAVRVCVNFCVININPDEQGQATAKASSASSPHTSLEGQLSQSSRRTELPEAGTACSLMS